MKNENGVTIDATSINKETIELISEAAPKKDWRKDWVKRLNYITYWQI